MTKSIAFALAIGLLVGMVGGCGKVVAPTKEPTPEQKTEPAVKSETAEPAAEAPADAKAEETAKPAEDIAALCKASCSKCHSFAKVEKYDGAVSWQDTVKRMVEERGAKIEATDIEKIVKYLDKTYPRK